MSNCGCSNCQLFHFALNLASLYRLSLEERNYDQDSSNGIERMGSLSSERARILAVSNTIAEFQPIIQQSRQRFPCLQGTSFHGNPGVVARVPRQPFHMPSPFLLNSVRMPVPAYLDGSVGRSPAPWNVHCRLLIFPATPLPLLIFFGPFPNRCEGPILPPPPRIPNYPAIPAFNTNNVSFRCQQQTFYYSNSAFPHHFCPMPATSMTQATNLGIFPCPSLIGKGYHGRRPAPRLPAPQLNGGNGFWSPHFAAPPPMMMEMAVLSHTQLHVFDN